jgi:hypothetical protein
MEIGQLTFGARAQLKEFAIDHFLFGENAMLWHCQSPYDLGRVLG